MRREADGYWACPSCETFVIGEGPIWCRCSAPMFKMERKEAVWYGSPGPLRAHDGALKACFFCRNPWGKCTCPQVVDDDAGFLHKGDEVLFPNLSMCCRFYVNPEESYGEDYLAWVRRGGLVRWFSSKQPLAIEPEEDAL